MLTIIYATQKCDRIDSDCMTIVNLFEYQNESTYNIFKNKILTNKL